MSHWLVRTAVLAACALVAVGCGQYGSVETGGPASTGPGDQAEPVSEKPFDKQARAAAGCTEIESQPDRGQDHTDSPDDDVDYEDNPPTSGKHSPQPQPWGLYNEEIRDEAFVHSLEHGHMVVLYKGLDNEQVDKLLSFRDKDPYHIVMAPRSENPKDGVYMITWRRKLFCEEPSAEAWQAMLEYRDTGPELVTGDKQKE